MIFSLLSAKNNDFLVESNEKIIFGWKKILKNCWSLFSVKIECLIWGPPKISNLSIWGQKWAENKQTCLISNVYHQEMCFHTLSVSITQKTIEIVGIEFWTKRWVGGTGSNPSKDAHLSLWNHIWWEMSVFYLKLT